MPRTPSATYAGAALTLVASLAFTPSHARAQDPDSVIAIEPIEVRVLGSAIETGDPYPVSVITGPQLTRGTLSAFLDEAVRAVPGVQIQNRFNLSQGERVVVRGFGSRAQFGVRGIRVLVDGIPATLPDGQATLDHLDFAELGRVEVLRGPNATLYGNAAGGVLHFRTADPATVPAEIGVRWSGSTLGSTTGATPGSSVRHGMWTLEARGTGTVGKVGYRIGVTTTDFDGYRRNPIANDGSTFGAGDRTTVNATAAIPLGRGTFRVVAAGVDLDAENAGSLPADSIDSDRDAWRFNILRGTVKDAQQGQIGLSWTGQLGSTTSEFAAWGIRRELYNPIPSAVIDLGRNAGGARALVQGRVDLGQGAALGWGAGVEAEFQRDTRFNFANDGGTEGRLTLDQRERVRGTGIFAQARLDAGWGVSVLAGARYDNVHFAVDDKFVGGGDPDDTGSRTMDAFSPSMGLVVEAGRHIEIFGSLGRSFETPTTTELANRPGGAGGFNPDLEPQYGVTVEGGARGTFANRVRAEAVFFRTDIRDQLVPFTVPSAPDRDYFRNAARSRSSGVELSVDWRIIPVLSARLAYTYVDATFRFFETGDDVYTGNQVPGLAPNRFDGLLLYQRGWGFLEFRGLWQDEMPVNDANSADSPSYFLLDARVGAEDLRIGSGFFLSPFFGVSNILDETYNSSVVPNGFGQRFFEPGPPRTYRIGVGLTWR